jgi:hypothetical protein
MHTRDSVVAIYETHAQADQALRVLDSAGIDSRALSIEGKEAPMEEEVVGYYNAWNRMRYWGAMGAFGGVLWGLVFDTALFPMSNIGPVVLTGPLASWIVAVLQGAIVFGIIGTLVAGLVSIRIPKDSVLRNKRALTANKFLLIVHGSPEIAKKATDVIEKTRGESLLLPGDRVRVFQSVKA